MAAMQIYFLSLILISLTTAQVLNASELAAPSPSPSTYIPPALNISIRVPPSLNPQVNNSPPAWQSPPEGWFYGSWQLTYSSNTGYHSLNNIVFVSAPSFPSCGSNNTGAATIPNPRNASCPTSGPVTPPNASTPQACPPGTYPGQNIDLTLYTLNNTGTLVYSAFGYDTPRRSNYPELGPGWNSVYDFQGTGGLTGTENSWELLAWGYDENGDGYLVIYETAVSTGYAPADIDIESRSRSGPSNGTYKAIIQALEGLGNQNVTELINGIQPIVFDDNYVNEPGFICGPACVDNCASYGQV